MFLALRSFAHKSAILEHFALLQPLQNVQREGTLGHILFLYPFAI